MFQLHKSNRLRIYVETLQGEFFGRCLRQLVDLLPPKRVQGAGEEASEPKPDKDDQYKVRSSFLFSFLLFSSLLSPSLISLLSRRERSLSISRSVNLVRLFSFPRKKKRKIRKIVSCSVGESQVASGTNESKD